MIYKTEISLLDSPRNKSTNSRLFKKDAVEIYLKLIILELGTFENAV